MDALRRYKLAHLITTRFGGNRGAFLASSGLSKGRLSQLLDPNEPFGDVAARRLVHRLELPEGYFDTMDAKTLEFAVAFDALPPHQKEKWLEIVALLGKDGPA